MAEPTFRDFAAAIMKGDVDAAGGVLVPLLGLSADAARAAAQHFQHKAASDGPAFMARAMGLRTALASGTDAEISGLLADCFGLAEPALTAGLAALKARS